MIGSDMEWNIMFGEDMDYKQFSQIIWGNDIYYWNKYSLLGELVNNNQNYVKAR